MVRVTDVEGEQVPDLVAVDASDPRDRLSMANTRLIAGRWNLAIGMGLFSMSGVRLFTVVADTVGMHNLAEATATPVQIEPAMVRKRRSPSPAARASTRRLPNSASTPTWSKRTPASDSFSATCTTPMGDAHTTERGPDRDYAELRAERSSFMVVSNCPQRHNNINGVRPTPLRIRLTAST